MEPKIQSFIDDLHGKYVSLISMVPKKKDNVPNDSPEGGIYMFSEGNRNLYVGRTKRKIKDRLKDHISRADDCPFAWLIAREKTGETKASYKQSGSRKNLLSRPYFKSAYEEAKKQIREMDIRYVGENNPIKQALLEIYVAVVANAKYNDFNTH